MTKSSERIEEEIDGLRERMKDRIDTTAREFSPKALAARVTGQEDPSASEMLDWAVQKARNNPLSTALVALGLLGLATQSNERTRLLSRRDVDKGTQRIRGYASKASDTARGYIHDAADVAVEAADDAVHYARETAESASRAVTRSAHDAELAARRAARYSADTTQEGVEWVKRNPTATGLFALAIGAAAASMFAARRNQDPVLAALSDDSDYDYAPIPARRAPVKRAPRSAPVAAASAAGTTRKSTRKSAANEPATRKRSTSASSKTAASGASETVRKARQTRARKTPTADKA